MLEKESNGFKISNANFLNSFFLENLDLTDVKDYFQKAYKRMYLSVSINSENNYISLRNNTDIDYFEPPRGIEIDFPEKKSVGNIVYLYTDKTFSIHFKNIPIFVQNKHPQMRSYYDFENSTINITMYGLEKEIIDIGGKEIIRDRNIHEPKFIINKFRLNDNNLLIFDVNNFEKQANGGGHIQKLEKLTEWN